MELHRIEEDYLEGILILSKNMEKVRAVDIVGEFGVSKVTVSNTLKRLKKHGAIVVNEDGGIALTKEGRIEAENISIRHTMLTKLLVAIGVDEGEALKEAGKLKHDISDTTCGKILEFLENTD